MKTGSARLISIAGHPAVIMPVAVVCATRDADAGVRWAALSLVAVAVAGVMLYSAHKARSGAWSHIDASGKHERSQLNRFASLGLLAFAGVLMLTGSHPRVAAAIGLSGALVLAGHLLKGRLKPSLHVAFAAFAAGLVWPEVVAVAALLAATAVVAWRGRGWCFAGTVPRTWWLEPRWVWFVARPSRLPSHWAWSDGPEPPCPTGTTGTR